MANAQTYPPHGLEAPLSQKRSPEWCFEKSSHSGDFGTPLHWCPLLGFGCRFTRYPQGSEFYRDATRQHCNTSCTVFAKEPHLSLVCILPFHAALFHFFIGVIQTSTIALQRLHRAIIFVLPSIIKKNSFPLHRGHCISLGIRPPLHPSSPLAKPVLIIS